MTDEERQARIGELRRVCVLLSALWDAIDERLDVLETAEAVVPTPMDVRGGLDYIVTLIAATPVEGWGSWLQYELDALSEKTNGDEFRSMLEGLQTEIGTRLEEL